MGDLFLKMVGAGVLAFVVVLIALAATGGLSVEIKNDKSGKARRWGGIKGEKPKDKP